MDLKHPSYLTGYPIEYGLTPRRTPPREGTMKERRKEEDK
jgi:hypothetical protein